MLAKDTINLLAYASGVGAATIGSEAGPVLLQQSTHFAELRTEGITLKWQKTIKPDHKLPSKLAIVAKQCNELAHETSHFTQQKQFFAVFGGDHTCAIGTWSGVAHAKRQEGDIGLIWIDAHMDSHTPETSQSGNLHGMPVASLLGHGASELTNILDNMPKIKPEHICLIGIRSYEEGEEKLLKQLNVKVFFMDEVKKRGLAAVFADAQKIVSQGTSGYGLSIDLDGIDPQDAPATGVAEPDGIPAEEMCKVLRTLATDPRLIGFEIVEFDPSYDIDHKTEQLIPRLVRAITQGS